MNPEQLGPYRIVGVLGRGGMGAVYRGLNVDTDEPAAIKILSENLSHEEGFRQRFEAEIETLRKLFHPNIVQLFGFGEQDGILFYAMELVEGNSLEEEIRRGRRFDWRETARIGIQTCRALRHAHDRGITHRDIKPANLLLTVDGRVKLSDFGIARLFGYSRLTAAGNVVGTVEYMAPEQADAKPVGPRGDLYSLGGVLFALLAGRPPFRARSLGEMLDKQRTAVPEPIRRLVPDVPEEFEQLIAQLLEKDPEKRVANATLMARRLEAMLRALAPDAAVKLEVSGSAAQPAAPPAPPPSGSPPEIDLPATQITDAAKPSPPAVDPPPPAQELPETRFDPDFGREPLTIDHTPAPAGGLPETQLDPGLAAAPLTGDLAPPEEGGALETRAMEEPDEALLVPPSPPEPPGETREDPEVYGLAGVPQGTPTRPPTAVTSPGTRGRFVAVAEKDLDRVDSEGPSTALISVHTLILAGALVCIGLTVWYFLRPPSADALYDRIARKTADKTVDSFRDAEREIDEFLTRFSTDSRSFRLREYRREIELYKLERKLENRAKGRAGTEGLLPIERAYVRAVNLALIEPEEALAQLQAMADLYRDRAVPSGPTGECLELIQRQIERLKRQLDGATADAQAEVESRLQRADELRTSDPAIARAIWKAVVELHRGHPWASEAVRRAKEGLAKTPEPVTSGKEDGGKEDEK